MKRVVAIVVTGFLTTWALDGAAQNVIESAGTLFVPSFRGEADATGFGWSEGSFFTTPAPGARRQLNNPLPTIGNVGLNEGVRLFQLNWTNSTAEVIGAASNNIYKGGLGSGSKPPVDLVVSAPTLGQMGQGFTTLIIQGTSLTGGAFGSADGFLINQPLFGSINGIAPEFAMGATADNRAQFWVKYELVGNQSVYDVPIFLPTTENSAPVSISGLTVDSYWSADGFAPDFAVVSEPTTWILLGLAAVFLLTVRRSVTVLKD